MKKYLNKFANVTHSHYLQLFDKLVPPILNYASEVWGFAKAAHIERVHLLFCKKLLSVKQCTQNDFVYGELGVDTFTQLFFIKSFSYLQVTMTYIRAWMISKFGQILSGTT